jgi:hypothetical protein
MEKNEEKILEGEVVIKKVDSEGFIYYESLNNASEPNWENFNIFLQNMPVKELIIGTVVFSIIFLLPNVTWAKRQSRITTYAFCLTKRTHTNQYKPIQTKNNLFYSFYSFPK